MSEAIKIEIETDITPVVTSILKVYLKPYNDLLGQMLKDGRVTKEELNRLKQQIRDLGQ